MSNNKPIIFSGYVQLKRKRFWVTRFAVLYKDRFIYSESETDIEIRGEYKLSDIEISQTKEKDDDIILLRRKSDGEVLRIHAKKHAKWYEKLQSCYVNIVGYRNSGQSNSSNAEPQFQLNDALTPQLTSSQGNNNEFSDFMSQSNYLNNNSNNANNSNRNYQTQIDFLSKQKGDNNNNKTAESSKGNLYLLDRELVKPKKPSEEILRKQRDSQAASESKVKYLVSVSNNLKVFNLGKELESVRGIGKNMRKFIGIVNQFLTEDLQWKGLILLFSLALWLFGYIMPFCLTMIAFWVMFVYHKKWQVSKEQDHKLFAFEIQGYLKININEFIKYLSIVSSSSNSALNSLNPQQGLGKTNDNSQVSYASSTNSLLNLRQWQINCSFCDEQVIIEMSDRKSREKIHFIVRLQIYDADGFMLSTIIEGNEKSYARVVDFIENCEREISTMRRDSASELFQYCTSGNNSQIFDLSEVVQKYKEHCVVVVSEKNQKLSIKKDNQQNGGVNGGIQLKKDNNITNADSQKILSVSDNEMNLNGDDKEKQVNSNNNSEEAKYQKIIDDLADKIESIVELNSENNWEECGGDKDIKIHRKFDDELGVIQCRGECNIPCSVKELQDFMMDVQSQKIFNSYYQYGEVVEKFNDSLQIIYSITKKIVIIDPREVLGIQGVIHRNNKVLVCCKSITDRERISNNKKAVRVDLIVGGFVLKELSSTLTNCIYVVSSDPKGSIPTFVKNIGMKEQAMTPNLIRKYFQQRLNNKK